MKGWDLVKGVLSALAQYLNLSYPTIKRLLIKKFIDKIHTSTLEAGFQGSVMERQITFKPFPGSSRNGQHDIYFHVKCNSLIRPSS